MLIWLLAMLEGFELAEKRNRAKSRDLIRIAEGVVQGS